MQLQVMLRIYDKLSIWNITFDGDEMNMVLSLDNKTTDELANLAPHKNILDLDNPRSLTDAARIPKPVASTISNWIHGDNIVPRTQEQDNFINQLV